MLAGLIIFSFGRACLFYYLFADKIIFPIYFFISTTIEIAIILWIQSLLFCVANSRLRILLAALLAFWVFFIYSADFIFYFESGRHINFELLTQLDPIALYFIKVGAKEHWLFLIAGLLILAVPMFNQALFSIFERASKAWISGAVILPIAYWFAGENLFINNPIYNLYISAAERTLPQYIRSDFSKSIKISKETIEYNEASFIESRFPFIRKTIASGPPKSSNIVLIILESWSAYYTQKEIGNTEVTPQFNMICKKGLCFTRAYATGNRTANGIISILLGFPDLPQKSLTKTGHSKINFKPLPLIMKQNGFSTTFLSTGNLEFERLLPFMEKWGFDEVIDRSNFSEVAGDKELYARIAVQMAKQKEPYFIAALTSTSHFPYHDKPDMVEKFDVSTENHRYLNSLYHADTLLGKFIKNAKTNNTIFIFISDHTSHRGLNFHDARHIPMAVYSPGQFNPENIEGITSQLDLIPLVLRLLNLKTEFSAMGKNPLGHQGYAFFAFGSIYGSVERDGIFFNNYRLNSPGLFLSPDGQKNKCGDIRAKSFCLNLNRRNLAFLNAYTYVIESGLAAPIIEE